MCSYILLEMRTFIQPFIPMECWHSERSQETDQSSWVWIPRGGWPKAKERSQLSECLWAFHLIVMVKNVLLKFESTFMSFGCQNHKSPGQWELLLCRCHSSSKGQQSSRVSQLHHLLSGKNLSPPCDTFPDQIQLIPLPWSQPSESGSFWDTQCCEGKPQNQLWMYPDQTCGLCGRYNISFGSPVRRLKSHAQESRSQQERVDPKT